MILMRWSSTKVSRPPISKSMFVSGGFDTCTCVLVQVYAFGYSTTGLRFDFHSGSLSLAQCPLSATDYSKSLKTSETEFNTSLARTEAVVPRSSAA